MARNSKIQKRQKKTILQTTCPQSQTRAPMGSAVLFFCAFFDFRGFCMVCSRWPEPRKSKKKLQTTKRQEPQWGLQLQTTCPRSQTRAPMGSAVFFSRFLHGLLQMARTSKIKKKTKLQTTCPQSQTRAPMGSAVLFFLLFGIFEVFAWFALLYTVVVTSNCPLLCKIHIEPFKTLQNQNFHIPPPHPPLSSFRCIPDR